VGTGPVASEVWDPQRWFRRVMRRPVAGVPASPAAPGTWAEVAAAEDASAGTERAAWFTWAVVDTWRQASGEVLGRPLSRGLAVRLLGNELAPWAVTAPGDLPEAADSLVLADLAAGTVPDPVLAALEAVPVPTVPARGDGPAWAAVSWDDGLLLRVRTPGTNWLFREPLPLAFYGTERLPESPDPVAWEASEVAGPLSETVGAPARWRTDWWLGALAATQPFAVVEAATRAPDVFLASVEGTAVAAPLLATWGELLLPEVPDPLAVLAKPARVLHPEAQAVRALLDQLGVVDEEGLALCRARDLRTGELPLSAGAVRERLARPLRAAIVGEQVEEARRLVALGARLGGPGFVSGLRDLLLQDGGVSLGEWNEQVGRTDQMGWGT
jgi:hypothetical protein